MPSTPRAAFLILIPAVVILLEATPQLHFLLPSVSDRQTESYEPSKTFRFIAEHGRTVHGWGPVPCLFFAPAYWLILRGSRVPQGVGLTNAFYRLDFDDPELMGRMILAARFMVLMVALGATVLLTWTLARNLTEPRVGLVVLACLSTSIFSLEPWSDTHPDGLMNALMMISLASYANIVMRGLTMGRALVTTLFYVASLSCKELTSTSMFLPFAAITWGAFRDLRREPAQGRRKLRILIASCFGVLGFYFLINVIYAPHAWWDRMHVVFGALKDPAIWASPYQTKRTYLRDTLFSAVAALGLGGLGALAIALIGTLLQPSARLAGLWLPFLSHLIFTTVLAGYIVPNFMIPLAPMLCLPASEVLARWLRTREAKPGREALIVAVELSVCLYLGFNGLALFRQTHRETLVERSLYEVVATGATVNVMVPWRTTNSQDLVPGPNGTRMDRNPVFALIRAPRSKLPEYILVDRSLERWLGETRLRPARAAMILDATGYDYRNFQGVESMGYDLVSTIEPRYPKWVIPGLALGHWRIMGDAIKVFRLRPHT